jgi:hypothetical protein
MVAKRRTRKISREEELLAEYGFEEITPENADEQFGKLLSLLDRIDDKLFELVSQMRANRKKIEAGLERIARRGDEIDRMLAEMKNG